MAEVKTEALMVPTGYLLPTFNEVELGQIAEYFRSHQAGMSKFTPKICTGPSCHEHTDCPLVRMGKPLPIGRMCFIELNLINTWAQGMARELDIKPDDVFDRWQIGAIALNGVLIKRAAEALGRSDIVVDSFRGFTPEGAAVMEQKAHPAIGIIDTLQKRNQALQTDLMATRKEKSKEDARKRLSPTEVLQRLREKMKLANKGVEDGQKRLIEHRQELDAEFTVVEAPNHASTIPELPNGNQGDRGMDARGQAEQAGPVVRPEHQAPTEAEGQEAPGREGHRQVHEVKRDPKTGFLIRE